MPEPTINAAPVSGVADIGPALVPVLGKLAAQEAVTAKLRTELDALKLQVAKLLDLKVIHGDAAAVTLRSMIL